MTAAGQIPPAPAAPAASVTELLRRGLDSAIANWPVLLVRMAEAIFVGILAVLSVLATVVPLLVSIGLSKMKLDDPENAAAMLRSALVDHWLILVYMAVAVSVVLMVFVAIHSFVIAGAARIFVNAEKAAGRTPAVRQRFAVFSIESWMAGAREAWWRVFWIYNIAYGVAGLVIMLPLLPAAGLIILLAAAPAAIVVSCLTLVVAAFLSLIVLVVTGIVCQKAIVIVAQQPVDATEALRLAWRSMRIDFSRHFGIAFIMYVLTFGGSGVLGIFSLGLAAPGMAAPFAVVLLLPLRLMMSMISSVFTAAVSNWFLAAFAALAEEERIARRR